MVYETIKTKHCCLKLKGKGYPDINTRLMLKKVFDSHKLPIYVLTDGDPHGIEIMLTYRYGSQVSLFRFSRCFNSSRQLN